MEAAPECIYSGEIIAEKVRGLGTDIRRRHPDEPLTLLGVLKGAALFSADLARMVGGSLELSFVQARSYGKSTTSSGRVVVGELEEQVLRGQRVVVADTVLDTGLTLSEVVARLRALEPASILTCVLVDKPARRSVEIEPDLVGFTAPDRFLVGYGLDYAGRYRSLPYMGFLEDEAHG
ncbi:MAG: phosphoribosyltransferase [Planctomycetota bacterium]|jgi:hypoxanthine phosphoribosyltransferase